MGVFPDSLVVRALSRQNPSVTQRSEDTAIRTVWDAQSVWSQAANKLKLSVERARLTALALGIAAATLGTVAAQTMSGNPSVGRAFAAAAAVAAGTAPLMAQRGGPGRLSDWTRLRAVSEAFKAEAYAYLAGGGAQHSPGAADALLGRVAQYRASSVDLSHYTFGLAAVARPLPAVTDPGSYVEHRLKAQLTTYYRPKAELMHRRVRFVQRLEFLLGGLGALMAGVSGVYGVEAVAAWIAVAASVSVAVAAHSTAQRYAYQQLEFSRTAQELKRLLERWEQAIDRNPAFVDGFITECESVISIQNEAWMIRWTLG